MEQIYSLLQTREKLIIEYLSTSQDFQEYIKSPVCSVDVEQLKYQIDFTLNQIKDIDSKVNILCSVQLEKFNIDFKNLQTLFDIENSKRNFTVKDLPKKHFSLFDEPFL